MQMCSLGRFSLRRGPGRLLFQAFAGAAANEPVGAGRSPPLGSAFGRVAAIRSRGQGGKAFAYSWSPNSSNPVCTAADSRSFSRGAGCGVALAGVNRAQGLAMRAPVNITFARNDKHSHRLSRWSRRLAPCTFAPVSRMLTARHPRLHSPSTWKTSFIWPQLRPLFRTAHGPWLWPGRCRILWLCSPAM